MSESARQGKSLNRRDDKKLLRREQKRGGRAWRKPRLLADMMRVKIGTL